MRLFFFIILIVLYKNTTGYAVATNRADAPNGNNVFIISMDGFRWQELFTGADSLLISDPEAVKDTSLIKGLFWSANIEERRKKLMPFFWNVIAHKGQLFGNKNVDNSVNVSNIYRLSYPGYNEILTGKTDLTIYSNDKKKNTNVTLLDYLSYMPSFAGKVAAFTSWNLFSFILNKQKSNYYINCAYSGNEKMPKPISFLNRAPIFYDEDKNTRNDLLTVAAAQQYIKEKKPKVLYIGLGGTDEYAHQGKYGQYLTQAHLADRLIGDLWQMVQSMPFYKNNITFVFTTDHGRGNSKNTWRKHGFLTEGSSQTWLAFLGKGIRQLGEIKQHGQLHQTQIAGTIGELLGVHSFRNYTIPVSYLEVIN